MRECICKGRFFAKVFVVAFAALAFCAALAVQPRSAFADEQALIDEPVSTCASDEAPGLQNLQYVTTQDASSTVYYEVKNCQDMARAELSLINETRVAAGSEEISWSTGLEATALLRAQECAYYFAHVRPNGTTCYTAFPSAWTTGENIAAGQTSVEGVHKGWVASQGHYENMIYTNFNSVGVGCVYANGTYYWAQAYSSAEGDGIHGSANTNTVIVSCEAVPATSSISVSPSEITFYVGKSQTVSVKNTNRGWTSKNVPLLAKSATWTSSNESVASVNEGVITAVSPGTTTITATIAGSSIEIPVTVKGGTYAVLYENGALVFQENATAKTGYGVISELWTFEPESNVFANAEEVPWAARATDIVSVSSDVAITPTSMAYWFSGLTSLTNFDATNFDTSSTTDMNSLFENCSSLKSIDLRGFDTSSVTSLGYLFSNCTSLERVNLSSFDTSSVTDMRSIFFNCSALMYLDLRSFDMQKLKTAVYMFGGCQNLQAIYVSENFATPNTYWAKNTFSGCTKLVGGNGTAFNSSAASSDYMRIDGEGGKPGYFTKLVRGDVNLNGHINVVDAQVAFDLANGFYTNDERYDLFASAADITGNSGEPDGAVSAQDAFAILYKATFDA